MGRVAALIPAYNCATRVGAVVTGVRGFVADVVAVDDGSTDQTAQVAREAGARVVVHPSNRGKGASVRSGLAVLLGEDFSHILMLDADGQHDPADVPNFLAAMDEADLILGNRLWNPGAIPARRFWTNFIGTRALQLMTGFPLEDSQCGFRLVASSCLRRMGLIGSRYSVDTEIIVRAGKLGARFAHVPVRVIYGDVVSHYRPIHDTVHIVLSAARFKIDERDLRVDPGAEVWRRAAGAPRGTPQLPESAP
ncbi:MAG: glycosyltransferase family 2 protein [Thermoanaerobaculales bacterium]